MSKEQTHARSGSTKRVVVASILVLAAALLISVSVIHYFRVLATELKTVRCRVNLREMGYFMYNYAQENGNRLPDPNRWCDVLLERFPHIGDSLVCPRGQSPRCNYAMNPDAQFGDPDIVLLFETDGGWNQHGGPELLIPDVHKGRGSNFLFGDGAVMSVEPECLDELVWKNWGFRRPKDDRDRAYWLTNMVWHHRFTDDEIRAATGMRISVIEFEKERLGIRADNRPKRGDDAPLLVLPYPGGRHPRIGFLDGAIDPQRETKFSVFTPWDANSYVVVDVPEAIWSNLGLTYLAHTHIDTIWSKQGIELEKLEWNRYSDGWFSIQRKLPNGIVFGVKVEPTKEAVLMEMWLVNGTAEKLTDLRIQNCVMTKMAEGFDQQTNENKVLKNPYAACKSSDGKRWIITAWQGCHRPWANDKCPCFHSDPKFPDLEPGQKETLKGWLSFYEGDDIEGEFKRIEATGWRQE